MPDNKDKDTSAIELEKGTLWSDWHLYYLYIYGLSKFYIYEYYIYIILIMHNLL